MQREIRPRIYLATVDLQVAESGTPDRTWGSYLPDWDTVTEDVQEACMQRLTARLRFSEGLPAELAAKVATQFCDEHAERFLLAFAYGYLGERDLLKVRTDPKKYLLLAVFNLVD